MAKSKTSPTYKT